MGAFKYGVYLVDGFPMPVCKITRAAQSRCFKGEAGYGYAVYLPRLKGLVKNEDDSVTGLEGLEYAWQESANDKLFRSVQDDVTDEYYYVPATLLAETLGVSLPLTLLNLLDAIIQHGEDDDPDGLLAIIN